MVLFKCLECGTCCHEYPFASEINFKRIPVFPEELEPLESYAKRHSINIKFIEDVIFPDTKYKKIIVITYRIILDGPNCSCPFYSKNAGCNVNQIKPLACKAYPLAQKQEDAYHKSIDIDPYCKFIEKIEGTVKSMTHQDLEEAFPTEFRFSKELMEKNKEIILKIKILQNQEKIVIPSSIKGEDYDGWLKKWERVYLSDLD
ncbi:MAG: YkgJ family cysteine cluster protein [Promethearchaeota archaeon]